MGKDEKSYWDLAAEKLHSEINEADQTGFEKLANDEKNQQVLRNAAQIKEGLKAIKPAYGIDSEASWNSIRLRTRRNAITHFATHAIKYVAIIVVAFLVGTFIHSSRNESSEIQYAEVEVLYGQMGHLFLFDGTEVWLNSGSKFKYPNQFNQKERNVYLTGEAYFKVAHNEALPFKVKTEEMEVEVLGTSFNVSAYDDEKNVSVVLEEGKVRLNRPDGSELSEMRPGQLAKLDSESQKLIIDKVDTRYYTNWKDGNLEFRGELLGDVVLKLERWYNVEINIEDPNLAGYHITGTVLRNKPVQQIIQAFEFLAPIRTEYFSKSNQKDIINIYKR